MVAILCRGIPFCTASVRGELNRRNLTIHTIASSNLPVRRDEAGELEAVLTDAQGLESGLPEEAILYFEIGRHSRPGGTGGIAPDPCGDILDEVALVVDDFPAMRARLQEAEQQIRGQRMCRAELREEAAAFLRWLQDAPYDPARLRVPARCRVPGNRGQQVEVDSQCQPGPAARIALPGARRTCGPTWSTCRPTNCTAGS